MSGNEKWVVTAKRGDFYGLAEKFGLDPVVIRLMVNRGVDTEEAIRKYLYGGLADLYDPLGLKDAGKAADLLQEAVDREERIVIASDFDVDGIFSGMILYTGLTRIGGKAEIKTPHRVREGYGLNRRIVDEALEEGAGLLITCDNGIAAFDALEYARDRGLPAIVTDHHELAYDEDGAGVRTYRTPPALAIVNPKQPDCPYPFSGLCGAGVAFKLIQILYRQNKVPEAELRPLLEYTAIATVADVMDLTDENRILVREGLKLLRRTQNPGLQALISVNQLEGARLSAYHIGFVLGPCFNAAGRLADVRPALDLLQARTAAEAEPLARQLKEMNDSRKDMTARGVEQAVEKIETTDLKNDKVLLVPLEDCHESLAGIIAGRIRERYNRPAIVLTAVADGYKGSGRSIEAYHMFDRLQACRPLLSRFGGHAMAAGISLPTENLPALREQLNRQCGLTEEDLRPVVRIDVAMPVRYLSEELVRQLEELEPFGKANPKPLFAEREFRIRRAAVLGKNRNTLKMAVAGEGGACVDALFFGEIEDFQEEAAARFGKAEWEKALRGEPSCVRASFTYYPSINEYRGMRTLQIVVQNYRFL